MTSTYYPCRPAAMGRAGAGAGAGATFDRQTPSHTPPRPASPAPPSTIVSIWQAGDRMSDGRWPWIPIYQGGPINWYIMVQSMYEPSHGVSCLLYNAQLPRRLAAASLRVLPMTRETDGPAPATRPAFVKAIGQATSADGQQDIEGLPNRCDKRLSTNESVLSHAVVKLISTCRSLQVSSPRSLRSFRSVGTRHGHDD